MIQHPSAPMEPLMHALMHYVNEATKWKQVNDHLPAALALALSLRQWIVLSNAKNKQKTHHPLAFLFVQAL